MRRTYNQISLPPGGHQSGLVASMAVRMFEAFNRHTRSEKALQYAVSDQLRTLRRHSFVVKFVCACQLHSRHFAFGGIVDDAQKLRQNFLPDFFCKSLSFIFVPLAVTLQPVTEHFVEKDRGRASTEQSRSRVRLRDRSFPQRVEVGGHLFGFCGQFLFVR